jgi:hypothetical protein
MPDESPTADLGRAARHLALSDGSPRDNRRSALTLLDEKQSDRVPGGQAASEPVKNQTLSDAYEEATSYVRQLSVAFKTLQILGQVAVNFPGTLEGPTKLSIVQEATNLGLRSLASMLALLRAQADAFVQHGVAHLRAEHPDLSDAEAAERTLSTVAALPSQVSHGVIRRIASAIGSPHLGPVYEQLMPDDSVPALRLVHCALRLEQQSAFPLDSVRGMHGDFDGNLLADDVLLSLVIHHLNVFELRFDLKQRICAELGIKYQPLQGVKPRALLVKKTGRSTQG